MNKLSLLLLFLLLPSLLFSQKSTSKIDGISLGAAFSKEDFEKGTIAPIKTAAEADWIAIVPYANAIQNRPDIIYDTPKQKWGERPVGVRATAEKARQLKLKIMLKPQVWMPNGWVGDFDPTFESIWREWEQEYEDYILSLAVLAEELQIELFCIGTEYKIAVRQRPKYWRQLIAKVRKVYSGKLTYASNWDNYYNISFWKDLDYVGIDSYFPISESLTPSVPELVSKWKAGPLKALKKFSNQQKMPILFTEYGYLTINGTAGKHWLNEKKLAELPLNERAQANAYEAFYKAFWDQDWVAGGFLWRWYCYRSKYDTWQDKDYTPQRKPAEQIVRECYKRF